MIQNYFANAHWLQVAVAGIAYFCLGAVWYARPVFGNYWAAKHNIVMNEDSKKRMPMLMISTLLLNLGMALGVGLALYVMQAPGTCMNGIKTGLFLSGVLIPF